MITTDQNIVQSMVSTHSMGAELCSNRAVATVDAWFMVVDQAETTFDDSQELQQKMFIIKILCRDGICW